MILKVYIQKNLYHLPRDQTDLTKMISETFYKRKTLVKSAFPKMYRITKIENSNLEFDKSVNLFLINLYLLVAQYKKKTEKDITFKLSDKNIINEISKELDKSFENIEVENIEKEVINFISNNQIEKNDSNGSEQGTAVEFNMNWIKEMDRKIRGE